MIYTKLTKKAMQIAYKAHHGQIDHGGIPYIFHPYHLAEQMDDEYSVCAALLHDVVEDTDVTLDELRADFPPEVTDAVALLTHENGVDYFEYVGRMLTNPIAVKVKLADLAHNSDAARIEDSAMTEEKKQYWKEKYSKARAILENGIVSRQ